MNAALGLTERRGLRARRGTAGAGDLATELAKTTPSYAGVLGAAVLVVTTPGPRTIAPWGMLAAIDLHGCERRRLADPSTIRQFVPTLIEAIGMRAHGPLRLERFGDGELEGYSAMQFIETSSITIHADEVSGRAFIDVFSCRAFDAQTVAAIAVAHFGGTPTITVLER
jgi:S-adenosylmethionine/arginine decarboxylase-like enzyme